MIPLISLLFSGISACLYRAGGMSKDASAKPAWIPKWLRDTKARDVGCSLLTCLWLGLFIKWHWTLILVFGLSWGALSTYWKQGADAKWYHWLFTGLGYSLAVLPLVIVEGNWIGFLSRTIILSGLTMFWSENVGSDVYEEMGRGALIPLTLPFLLVV